MSLNAYLSRISPQALIGRILRFPLRLIPKHTVVTVRTGLNRGMKWIVGSSIHGCWLGHYEQQKQELVRRIIKHGMNVLDVGANAGFYTLMFSRLVGKSGHVWAFEPLAENANNLLSHIRLNDVINATVVQAAVSDKAGLVGFDVASSNSMGAISDKRGDYMVPTVTLDDLIGIGLVPVPDLIKLDVEGAESLVLSGAHSMLLQRRTVLLIALHGDEQKRACLSILKAAGYDAFELDGRAIVGREDASFDEIVALPSGQAFPAEI